jgi:hypothetical protein
MGKIALDVEWGLERRGAVATAERRNGQRRRGDGVSTSDEAGDRRGF